MAELPITRTLPDPPPTALPRGFTAHVANVGIRDATDDFLVLSSDRPAVAAALFTKSCFVGPSVVVSRQHAADQSLQAFVVLSKNANVATGDRGLADSHEIVAGVAKAIGADPSDVLITSTGVIGRPLPMELIRAHLAGLSTPFDGIDAVAAARAMMTTDTVPKVASAAVGEATIVGVAKGVGMIEPDMATLLTFYITDAEVPAEKLADVFGGVIDRTFNSLSIDTDTSTSDTAAIMANGEAGPVDPDAFGAALFDVALSLTRQIARDGEGATKLLLVTVDRARNTDQARRVAKAVLNSPLVKTAVHGADPNWGRVAMAVGKCSADTDIDQRRVSIRFGSQEVFPAIVDDVALGRLASYMAGDEVHIGVSLDTGDASWTVYGCDLSAGYVRINADYTT